ncbi:MAG: hypothetical protein M1829_001218 [Trizodia sp. TS-e1964]|nr:MAG: hypothetical protein M1829_001218 [Trizodia sp. TS-e1964]
MASLDPSSFTELSDESDDDSVSLNSTELSEVQEEYPVERILAERTNGSKQAYLVKWENYPINRSTWEPIESFTNPGILDQWKESKLLQAHGLENAFDVDAFEQSLLRLARSTARRKARRKVKRERLGTIVDSEEEYEDADAGKLQNDDEVDSLFGDSIDDNVREASPPPRAIGRKRNVFSNNPSTYRNFIHDSDLRTGNIKENGRAPKRARYNGSTSSDDSLLSEIKKKTAEGNKSREPKKQKTGRSKEINNEAIWKQAQDSLIRDNSLTEPHQGFQPLLNEPPQQPSSDQTPYNPNADQGRLLTRQDPPIPTQPKAHAAKDSQKGHIQKREAPSQPASGNAAQARNLNVGSTVRQMGPAGTGPSRSSLSQRRAKKLQKNLNKAASVATPQERPRPIQGGGHFKSLSVARKYELRGRNELAPDLSQLKLFIPSSGKEAQASAIPNTSQYAPIDEGRFPAKTPSSAPSDQGQRSAGWGKRKSSIGQADLPDKSNKRVSFNLPSSPGKESTRVSFGIPPSPNQDSWNVVNHQTTSVKSTNAPNISQASVSSIQMPTSGFKEAKSGTTAPIKMDSLPTELESPQRNTNKQENYGKGGISDPTPPEQSFRPPIAQSLPKSLVRHPQGPLSREMDSRKRPPIPLSVYTQRNSGESIAATVPENTIETATPIFPEPAQMLPVSQNAALQPQEKSQAQWSSGNFSIVTKFSAGVPPKSIGDIKILSADPEVYKLLSSFGAMCLQYTCTAASLRDYFHKHDTTSFSHGFIRSTAESEVSIADLAVSLRSYICAGIVSNNRFLMILYPVAMDSWRFLDDFPDSKTPSWVKLKFQIRPPITASLGHLSVQLNSPVDASKKLLLSRSSPRGERALSAFGTLFEDIFNIRYSMLKPHSTNPNANFNNVFVLSVPSAADDTDLLLRLLNDSGATVYCSHTPGAWGYFCRSIDAGTILVNSYVTKRETSFLTDDQIHSLFSALHTIPKLSKLLRMSFNLWVYGNENPHSPSTSFSVVRLFPLGGILLLTDEIFIQNPTGALNILIWFNNQRQSRAPGTWKLAARSGLRDWLLNTTNKKHQESTSVETDEPKEDKNTISIRYKIWVLVDALLDTTETQDDPFGDLDNDNFVDEGPILYGPGKTTQETLEWYAGMAQTLCFTYRRFLAFVPRVEPELQKWNLLDVTTPEEYLSRSEAQKKR